MVERPIKKSSRQAAAPNSDVGEQTQGERRPIEERSDSKTSGSFERKDRTKKRGKGNQGDSRITTVNPAFVRGKKPTKPKPPVVILTPVDSVEDSVTPTSQVPTAIEDASDALTPSLIRVWLASNQNYPVRVHSGSGCI